MVLVNQKKTPVRQQYWFWEGQLKNGHYSQSRARSQNRGDCSWSQPNGW